MKKILLGAILLGGFSLNNAQISGSFTSPNNKWTFGGGAGVNFSNGSYYGTTLHISPRVGYKIDENLVAGLSGSFSWTTSKYYSSTMLGIGPFVNYYIGRSFYISGLYQYYFINRKDKIHNLNNNIKEDALYLGGGYMTRIGNGAYMQIGASYNVLYKQNSSVFGSAFVPNVGIVWGL